MIKVLVILLSCLFWVGETASLGQQMGTAKIPSDLLKSTVVIETMEIAEVTRYEPAQDLLAVVKKQGDQAAFLPAHDMFKEVKTQEVRFKPIGSGVLLSWSNRLWIATANHVIPPDENVFFRIAQRTNASPKHYSHRHTMRTSKLGWVRSTNADVALTSIYLSATKDDVKVMKLSTLVAEYEDVAIGDDIVVVGFPSSVIPLASDEANAHVIRSGVISSKLKSQRILIDAFTFPGDSGGPVFWKPAMGLQNISPPVEGRLPKLVGLVTRSPLYSEGAISPQSGRTRIIFESNSGLTEVVSASRILELLNYPQVQEALKRWDVK